MKSSRSILAIIALMVGLINIQSIYAQQDFSFGQINKTIGSVGKRGATAASPLTGYLNTVINEKKHLQLNGQSAVSPTDMAIGDFNADGLLDTAYIDGNGQLTILAGLTDGTFGPPLSLIVNSFALSIAAADVDFDGITDIVIGEQGGIEIFSGFFIVTGFLTSIDVILLTNATVVSVAIGDLDGDGLPDIAGAESSPSQIAVALFSTTTFSYHLAFNIPTAGTIPGDINGFPAPRAVTVSSTNFSDPTTGLIDSDLDLVVVASGSVEIFENINNASSFMPVALLFPGSSPSGVIVANVNNDSRGDILVSNYGSGTVSTFIANAGGGYNSPITSLVGAHPTTFSPFNFNNDGSLDIAVIDATVAGAPGDCRILTGNGNGAFTPARVFNSSSDNIMAPRALAVGQFDLASPTDDIIIGDTPFNASPGGLVALLSAANYSRIFAQFFTTNSLAANFDSIGGINDIALIEQELGIAYVILNFNSNNQQVAMINVANLTPTPMIPTSATAFRDGLTGLVDIAIAVVPANGNGNGAILVGLNDGSGNFGSFSFRTFSANRPTNLQAADFNNDGIQDLFYLDLNVNQANILLNNGANFFNPLPPVNTGGALPIGSISFADVNDDDSLDIVVLNQGTSALNPSTISILLGNSGTGFILKSGVIKVPDYALSLVGGLADIGGQGILRVVDFNGDALPDFAFASTRGGSQNPNNPSVTLMFNRPTAPGTFTLQPAIDLLDTAPFLGKINRLELEKSFGGPGIVSGRDIFAVGGANNIMSVGDFNADGSPDLVVAGAQSIFGGNFRSSIYLIGNQRAGVMRVAKTSSLGLAQRRYGIIDPLTDSGDTFIGCAVGEFSNTANIAPDVAFFSLNGNIWIDSNNANILNHPPVISLNRFNLNAPFPGGGRKEILTAGQFVTIPVTAFDVDGNQVNFQLVPTSTRNFPADLVKVINNGNNTATIMINTSVATNLGTTDIAIQVIIEATDVPSSGIPLSDRTSFTLVIKPSGLTAVAPTSGPVGTQVVLITDQAPKVVRFNGTPTSPAGSSVVPPGATTGLISAETGMTSGNLVATSTVLTTFTVTSPVITSFAPRSGPNGTQVKINGANFTGATKVTFNGLQASSFTVNPTGTQITVTVPSTASSGPVVVTKGTATSTTPLSFNNFFTIVLPGSPLITDFNPKFGVLGKTVTVTGANLTNLTSVTLNGFSVNFTPISPTSVSFTVPTNVRPELLNGPIRITNQLGTSSNPAFSPSNFTAVAATSNVAADIKEVFFTGKASDSTILINIAASFVAADSKVNIINGGIRQQLPIESFYTENGNMIITVRIASTPTNLLLEIVNNTGNSGGRYAISINPVKQVPSRPDENP